MKNIYFVQASVPYGDSIYLPYAAGALAAYAFLDETVRQVYKLKRIIYYRENIDKAVEEMEDPYLVGFSSYIWSHEYNKKFAGKLRERWPECIIVFGGHNIPSQSPELLRELQYVDFLIQGEGEVPFRDLLLALHNKTDFSGISNLSFRNPDGTLQKKPNRVYDVADFPSPYQAGVFDDIVNSTPYTLNGMLETNRGCPFGCLFCDWGVYKSKVRCFPEERVKNDIIWLAEHKIEFCTCADANFGILERDVKIADWIIESKKKTGYPSKVQFCYTKGREDVVFELNRKMNEVGLSKGATLSMQTLNDEALKNIGRKNLNHERLCEEIIRYNSLDIPTYTEIILGIPGETYDSFCEGMNKLLKAGQHNSIIVFNCELLLNSPMGQKETIEKFKIKSVKTPYKQHHCAPIDDDVVEYSHIVTSTYSMSEEDWIRSCLFVSCIGAFHNLGLLQCFALYLYFEKGIEYSAFYKLLLDWIFNHPEIICGEVFADIRQRLERIVAGTGDWRYVIPLYGPITWPFEEGAFLNILYRSEKFYDEILPFLQSFGIPEDVFTDLLTYQKNAVKRPGHTDFSFELRYDMNFYFNSALNNEKTDLRLRPNVVSLSDSSIPDAWPDYAREMVWYGKRGGRIINIRSFKVRYV